MISPIGVRFSGYILPLSSAVRRFSQISKNIQRKNVEITSWRTASTSTAEKPIENNQEMRLVHVESQFEATPPNQRDKAAFLAAISIYKDRKARNHVEFINAALKFLKPYGVHKDLDVYKALLNIFPKGKMIPQNTFQIKRMLYWMPKLKHSNKYLDRRKIEGKKLTPEELAGLVLQTICRDPGSLYSLVKFDDNISTEKGWIASAQSPAQQRLLKELPNDTQVFINGPYPVYLMDHKANYVAMTCEPTGNSTVDLKSEENKDDYSNWFHEWDTERREKSGTIHEQTHETILALAVLHRNDNKTGSIWNEHLQKTNPHLRELQPRIRLDKPVIITETRE